MERTSKRQRVRREPTYTKTTDQVSEIVKGLDQHVKVDIIQEMKRLIQDKEQGARDLLMENPQLAQALLIMQLDFEMCSKQELVKVVEPVALPLAVNTRLPIVHAIKEPVFNQRPLPQMQPQHLIPMRVPIIMPPPLGYVGPRPVPFPGPGPVLGPLPVPKAAIVPLPKSQALPPPGVIRPNPPGPFLEPKIEPGRKP